MKKTPFNKALLYDDNCPLCKAYSGAFVKAGLLTAGNRISFSNIKSCKLPGSDKTLLIDWQKAKHEIPLVDVETGEVKYGVEALVEILDQKIHFIKPLVKIKFVHNFFLNFYKLISYNRKIIVANCKPAAGEIDCSPDYNFFWRRMLILVTMLLSSIFILKIFSLTSYQPALLQTSFFIFSLCSAMLLFSFYKSKKIVTDLFAHVGIICTITTFLVLFVFLFKKIFELPPWLFIPLLIGIAYIFFKQITRRYRFISNTLT